MANKVIVTEPLGDWYDDEEKTRVIDDSFGTRHWIRTDYDDLHGA